MTYKRTAILEDTIRILYNQSHPPQKILIVDNDPALSAKDIVSKFSDFKIDHGVVCWSNGFDIAPEYLFFLANKDNPKYKNYFLDFKGKIFT